MDTAYDAAIELAGSVCRVAVHGPAGEHYQSEHALPSNGGAALIGADAPDGSPQGQTLTAIWTALQAAENAVAGTLQSLCVLLHAPEGFVVQAPLAQTASETEVRRALVQQAALLTGARKKDALRLVHTRVAAPLPGPKNHQWHRALVVSEAARQRIQQWADALDIRSATIAHSASRTCEVDPTPGGWHLGIGCYGTHTEIALWHALNCAYVYYTPLARTAADRIYFATLLLNRLQVAQTDLVRMWTYGTGAESASDMPALAGLQPQPARLVDAADLPASAALAESDAYGHRLRWAPPLSVLHSAAPPSA
ncbi:MAG: hypothetical protein PPP56_13290 [Longimonas sp.]|uniref:hypothetical protein n=1 Tax=Longimonas sp. TaxID=2039626 RepID=UPI00335A91C7